VLPAAPLVRVLEEAPTPIFSSLAPLVLRVPVSTPVAWVLAAPGAPPPTPRAFDRGSSRPPAERFRAVPPRFV